MAAPGGRRAEVTAATWALRNRRPGVAAPALALGLLWLAGPQAVADPQEPVPAPASAAPELLVRIAAPPENLRSPGWTSGVECAIGRASELLFPVLGRSLRARSRAAWFVPSSVEDLVALRSHLIDRVDHDGADLVVGLIPVAPSAETFVEDGLASYSHGYVVARVGPEPCGAGAFLAHEIAHVFGGVHRAGEGNLMDPIEPGERIDPLNAALLGLHRERLIREQAPPLRGPQLRMMWRLARADLDSADTWLRVGVLAAQMQQPESACAYYEQALALQPELRAAWVNLGHARMQTGFLELAERAYEQALRLDPNDGLLHNNLAVIFLSTGRALRASAAIQRALELGYAVPAALQRAVAAALDGIL